MPYCTSCNAERDGQFCSVCGAELVSAPPGEPLVNQTRGDTGLDRSVHQTVVVSPTAAGQQEETLPFGFCPIDGLYVRRDQTFRCTQCGRENLCREHLDAELRVCEECAAQIRGETQQDLEARLAPLRAGAEAQMQAGNMAEALLAYGQILALAPDDTQAARLAQEARQALSQLADEAQRRRQAAEEVQAQEQEAEAARRQVEEEASKAPVWRQVGIEMVPIPAGGFLYGDDKQKAHLPDYYLARTPVTNAQYKAFVEATGHRMPAHWENGEIPLGKENHPVVEVSWEDAQAFCQWAGCRLPTEQEWEKGARGTDGREYPWGDEWELGRCNTKEAGIDDTTPVDQHSGGASPYGLLDMAGNVDEWCQGWFDSDRKSKVVRGGSWLNYPNRARSAYRSGDFPVATYNSLGFRCCVSSTSSL